jgi:hypothetical protein
VKFWGVVHPRNPAVACCPAVVDVLEVAMSLALREMPPSTSEPLHDGGTEVVAKPHWEAAKPSRRALGIPSAPDTALD